MDGSLQEGDRTFLTALFQHVAADSSLVVEDGRFHDLWHLAINLGVWTKASTSPSTHCYPSSLITGLPPGPGRWAEQLSLT